MCGGAVHSSLFALLLCAALDAKTLCNGCLPFVFCACGYVGTTVVLLHVMLQHQLPMLLSISIKRCFLFSFPKVAAVVVSSWL